MKRKDKCNNLFNCDGFKSNLKKRQLLQEKIIDFSFLDIRQEKKEKKIPGNSIKENNNNG